MRDRLRELIEPTEAFPKDFQCLCNPHGCRLVSDGMVCQKKCEWMYRDDLLKEEAA